MPEELIGDIGAAQLANIAGIEYVPAPYDDNYITQLIQYLLNDSHLILYTSSQAQKAVDYILNC